MVDYIESNSEILWLIPVALIALVLAAWLLLRALEGAAVLLVFALAQGFVGLVAFVAAWVFLLPFMLVASVVLGLITRFASASATRREKRVDRWRRRHREGKVSGPPPDPAERYKWANRLPPYDS